MPDVRHVDPALIGAYSLDQAGEHRAEAQRHVLSAVEQLRSRIATLTAALQEIADLDDVRADEAGAIARRALIGP